MNIIMKDQFLFIIGGNKVESESVEPKPEPAKSKKKRLGTKPYTVDLISTMVLGFLTLVLA
jgi:hypothetical protein